MTRWQWAMHLLTRRMWFRAALFCLFAVALALIGALLPNAISYDFATKIGAKSVGNILNVLASSMLAVTTFSLTAMVSAYSAATSNITPRAVQLLVDDATAQNALATFLGSFLFAIVGIIALSTGIYGNSGRVILYAGTILVIAVIVVTFLRWIEHITRFGRVSDTIHRVEKAATKAVGSMVQAPRFGSRERACMPSDAHAVRHSQVGRITHVDLDALADVAEDANAVVNLMVLPGTPIDPTRVLAWTTAEIDEEQASRIRQAFTVADDRAFDQDPRFGLVVLSEIASRALSPAVNDPGTAIAVLESGTRVLAAMLRHDPGSAESLPVRVNIPPFNFPDLIDDLFRPIARDGAAIIEVGIRLQKSLAAVAAISPEARHDCRLMAAGALGRSCEALRDDVDREELCRVHDHYWKSDNPDV